MPHEWNVSPRRAVEIQKELRYRVRLAPFRKRPKLVAGVDISFNRHSPRVYAGVVVLALPSLETVERVGSVRDVHFPYVPGLLSFREIPPLLEAWAQLKSAPDLVVVDGQGIAHPRRLGIAAHLGLILDLPAIGCGKSRLVGTYEEPGPRAGDQSPLVDREETVGAVLRTKDRVNPVFVSPGHRMNTASAVRLLLSFNGGYRIPEPTRRAHLYVNELRLSDSGALSA